MSTMLLHDLKILKGIILWCYYTDINKKIKDGVHTDTDVQISQSSDVYG